MTKLAIIVGHNAEKRGATKRHGAETGTREYDWNGVLAGMIEARAEALGIDARVFYRAPGKGYLHV